MRLIGLGWLVMTVGCGTQALTTPEVEAASKARVGSEAPGFTLTDLDGKSHSLSDYRGKTVVVEWFNPGCPYVKYAHGEGPLAEQATRTVDADTVWLAINSGAPGKQGYGVELNQKAKADWAMAHPILVDEDGKVGKAYDAVTTPHMYVIDPEGVLRYQGAIDNAPLGKANGEPVNYVEQALGDLAAGRSVKTANTKAYGCSVKYGS
ncbi:MAG: thioredoxin family protein [Myxococcota bacterium]